MSAKRVSVLSIEDNPGDAHLIEVMLKEASRIGWDLPRFELEHVDRLEDGLGRLDQDGIDVILLDLDLPDSQAGDTFALLHAHAPDMPIVVLTGREDEELAARTVRAGAQDYLFKREMSGSLLAHALIYAVERQRANEALQQAHDELEQRVAERTQALRQSERELQLTLDATTDGIWKWDFRTDELTFSPRYYTMLGYEPDEFPATYQSWRDLIHPDDRERALSAAEEYLATKPDFYENEFRLRAKSGAYRWIQTRARVVERDENGEAVRMIGHHQDITERVRARQALQESEARYRAVVDASPSSIGVIQEGHYVFINPAGADMLGYASPEELGGVPALDTIAPDSRQLVIERMERLAAGEENSPATIDLIRPDGTIFAVESTSVPILFHGQPATLIIGQDVAERLQAEAQKQAALEALRAREEKVRAILDATTEAVVLIDRRGVVLDGNQAHSARLGLQPDELLGRCVWDMFPPDVAQRRQSLVESVFQSGQPVQAKDEREGVWNEFVIYPIHGTRGEVTSVAVYAQDITKRVQAERALRESEANLAALIESTDDIIVSRDRQGRALVFNSGFARIVPQLFGTEVQPGVRTMDYLPEAQKRHWEDVLEKVHLGTSHQEEFTWELGGETRHYALSLNPIWAGDDIIGSAEFTRDITERVRTEAQKQAALEALSESQQRFEQMAENIHEIFWLTDPRSARILYVSPAYEDVWQSPVKALYENPRRWMQLIHPDDHAIVIASQERQVRGQDTHEEFRIVRPDGTVRWIVNHSYPIQDEGGKVYRVTGVAEDITERKQMENALRESQQLLKIVFQSLREGVFVLDADTTQIIDCNPAVEDIFGYERDKLLGRTTAFLHVDQTTLEEFRSHLYPAVSKQGFLHLPQFRMKRKSGEVFSSEHYVMPLEVEAGQLVGWISVVRDVTERVRAERFLLQSNRELELLNRVIGVAASSLDLKRIFQTACRELAHTLAVPQAAATLLNEAGTALNVVAEYCEPGQSSAQGVVIPLEDNLASVHVLESRTPLVITEAQTDERQVTLHHLMRRRGTVSLLVVPIVSDGKAIGTIGLDAIERREFSQEEIALAQSVATAIGQAVAMARLHQALERHAVTLEERVARRTDELNKLVNAMAGREVRMAELKKVIRELRQQIQATGLTPISDDPLAAWQENKREGDES